MKTATFRLTDEDYQAIKDAAKLKRLTFSAYVRFVLIEHETEIELLKNKLDQETRRADEITCKFEEYKTNNGISHEVSELKNIIKQLQFKIAKG